jgi:hypothetical protein
MDQVRDTMGSVDVLLSVRRISSAAHTLLRLNDTTGAGRTVTIDEVVDVQKSEDVTVSDTLNVPDDANT